MLHNLHNGPSLFLFFCFIDKTIKNLEKNWHKFPLRLPEDVLVYECWKNIMLGFCRKTKIVSTFEFQTKYDFFLFYKSRHPWILGVSKKTVTSISDPFPLTSSLELVLEALEEKKRSQTRNAVGIQLLQYYFDLGFMWLSIGFKACSSHFTDWTFLVLNSTNPCYLI